MLKWLYYLPQSIIILWVLELFVNYADPDFYREWYQVLDFIDGILIFIAVIHFSSVCLLSIFSRRIKFKFSPYYLVCGLTIGIIAVLNLWYNLYPFDIHLYYMFYIAIIISNYTYYFSELEL